MPLSTATAPSSSSFLTERAQLEQERLTRLKRLRESHLQSPEPQPKRRTPSRATSCTPASQAGPGGRGKERAAEAAEVFWDGELRQTANQHVEPGRNGEDGTPVFRLSQIIGDVRPFFYSCEAPCRMNVCRNHRSN